MTMATRQEYNNNADDLFSSSYLSLALRVESAARPIDAALFSSWVFVSAYPALCDEIAPAEHVFGLLLGCKRLLSIFLNFSPMPLPCTFVQLCRYQKSNVIIFGAIIPLSLCLIHCAYRSKSSVALTCALRWLAFSCLSVSCWHSALEFLSSASHVANSLFTSSHLRWSCVIGVICKAYQKTANTIIEQWQAAKVGLTSACWRSPSILVVAKFCSRVSDLSTALVNWISKLAILRLFASISSRSSAIDVLNITRKSI